jgi:hypothetical protein
MGRAFSPEFILLPFPWGGAPGWYGAAPLALIDQKSVVVLLPATR